jgi:hypothetical protein
MCGRVIQNSGPLRLAIVEGLNGHLQHAALGGGMKVWLPAKKR